MAKKSEKNTEAQEQVVIPPESPNPIAIAEKPPANPYARAKGKMEFCIYEEKGDKSSCGGIVLHEHPLRAQRDQWMTYLRQIASVIPSYQDQFGNDVAVELIATYEINGQARSSASKMVARIELNSDLPVIMYDQLIQPIIKDAQKPNVPLDVEISEKQLL